MLWHHEGAAYVEGAGIEAERVSDQRAVREPLLCLEAAADSDGSLGPPHPAVRPTNFPWLPRASDPAHTRDLGARSRLHYPVLCCSLHTWLSDDQCNFLSGTPCSFISQRLCTLADICLVSSLPRFPLFRTVPSRLTQWAEPRSLITSPLCVQPCVGGFTDGCDTVGPGDPCNYRGGTVATVVEVCARLCSAAVPWSLHSQCPSHSLAEQLVDRAPQAGGGGCSRDP